MLTWICGLKIFACRLLWALLALAAMASTYNLPWSVAEACREVQQQLGINEDALEQPLLLSPDALLSVVVSYWNQWQPERYLNLLLLYGGQGGAALKMQEMGYCARSLDMINDPAENILCIKGALLTFYLVKCVVSHGTVWMSPACKSWLSFISRATYGRTCDPLGLCGDEQMFEVQCANASAQLNTHVMFLCVVQQCFYAIEQPLNSLLFKHTEIHMILETSGANRVVCHAGALGAPTMKPLEIYVTWPKSSAEELLQFTRKDARLYFTAKEQAPGQLASKRGRWTCGTKQMQQSAAYPLKLCTNIAEGAVAHYLAHICHNHIAGP